MNEGNRRSCVGRRSRGWRYDQEGVEKFEMCVVVEVLSYTEEKNRSE